MDNKINEIRRKISFLRSEMLDLEDAIRAQVNRDEDCSAAALRLMGLRRTDARPYRPGTRLAAKSACPMSKSD